MIAIAVHSVILSHEAAKNLIHAGQRPFASLRVTSEAASLPIGLVILILAGLLLVAFVLGALFARRPQPAPVQSVPPLDDVLNALPFPAALVNFNGSLVAVNTEATAWLESDFPPRLASPLNALARRAAASQKMETVQITLEGQSSLRAQASPLMSDGSALYGVLLIAPPGGASAGSNLTRLVAHELRTPLTAIVGHAEILSSCSPTDEALWRRSRDFIAAETQRLAQLVNDLLSLSRLEASPLVMQTINVRAAIETALSSLFDRAEAAGLTLTLDAPPSLPRVRADPHRLEQALVNLLDNAIKYTPHGGAVTIRLISEGGYVRVEVGDTGPGISPDDLPHLFEPLYRAESVRYLPGTGLGLTIVRAILDQHGAPVSVQSRPGQGATFTFRLPIAQ
jgi:signal transduction histidine kinase